MGSHIKKPILGIITAFTFVLLAITLFPQQAAASPQLQFIDCATQTAIPPAECAALDALYTSTNGTMWTDDTNWMVTDDPCSWFGVTCSGGLVTELDLNTNNLNGTLPTQLEDLTALTTLDISANANLTGSLPDSMINLGSLATFDFSGTNLCEPQESAFQTWISTTVTTSYNSSGIDCQIDCSNGEPTVSQAECTALFSLYTNTSGDSWTDNTDWLTNYDICVWNGVTCSGGVVTELDLNTNNLDGIIPTDIDDLANLTLLDLSSNSLTSALPGQIGNIGPLVTLDISGNAGLTGNIPNNLTSLGSLTTFDFSSTDLCEPQDSAFLAWVGSIITYTDSGILCEIDCSSTETTVDQAECEALFSLYNNTTGDSWNDNTNWLIDYDVCTWFGVTCSGGHISDIALSSNNLDGSVPSQIGNFPYMTDLDLSTNSLTGSLPNQMTGLVNLLTFNMADNTLSGALPSTMGNLSNLVSLDLANNAFDGQVPLSYAYLNNLTYLDTTGSTLCLPDDTNLQNWYAGITTVVDPISDCYVAPTSTYTSTPTSTVSGNTLTPTPIPSPTITPTATQTPTITPTPTMLGQFQTLTALAMEDTLAATNSYLSRTPTSSPTSYYVMVSQTLVPLADLTRSPTSEPTGTPVVIPDSGGFRISPFWFVALFLALGLIGTGVFLMRNESGFDFAALLKKKKDDDDDQGGFQTFQE